MSDQVEIQIPKTVVTEEDTFPAVAYFRTRATKLATAPTTIRYRVDDLKTGKILTDWTTVSAAANVTITITAANNEIQDESSRLERKQLIVQADSGLSTQVNGRVLWKVRNVREIVFLDLPFFNGITSSASYALGLYKALILYVAYQCKYLLADTKIVLSSSGNESLNSISMPLLDISSITTPRPSSNSSWDDVS